MFDHHLLQSVGCNSKPWPCVHMTLAVGGTFNTNSHTLKVQVHTGKSVSNSRTFQGLLKDFPIILKDCKFMKPTDSCLKILLQKCYTDIMKKISVRK